jgi:hypothetical protein
MPARNLTQYLGGVNAARFARRVHTRPSAHLVVPCVHAKRGRERYML